MGKQWNDLLKLKVLKQQHLSTKLFEGISASRP